jgi:hypothetical protein
VGIKLSQLLALMDYRPYRGTTGEEDRLAIAVATMLRVASIEGRLKATWTCIPHEVGAVPQKSAEFKKRQTRYAKAKAMGLITGSTDYVFVWAGGGGWIELKSQHGSLSTPQRTFRDWARATGCNWAVCRSVEEVVEKLIEWRALQS